MNHESASLRFKSSSRLQQSQTVVKPGAVHRSKRRISLHLKKQSVRLHPEVCQSLAKPPRIGIIMHQSVPELCPRPRSEKGHPEMSARVPPGCFADRSQDLLPFFYWNKPKHYEPGGSGTKGKSAKSLPGQSNMKHHVTPRKTIINLITQRSEVRILPPLPGE